jgi:hypothetical protein
MADRSFVLGIHDANMLIQNDKELAENLRTQMALQRIIKCKESRKY